MRPVMKPGLHSVLMSHCHALKLMSQPDFLVSGCWTSQGTHPRQAAKLSWNLDVMEYNHHDDMGFSCPVVA